MNKQHILSILFLSIYTLVSSQTATEAYRLSISDPLGTARNAGVGNSMFNIGPDISAIGSNPAGIGGFWKSEFTVTGDLLIHDYSSYFSDDRNDLTQGEFSQFSLSNIGFIAVSRPGGSWKTSNWAIGMNRMAEYRREIQYTGNPVGSMTDSWRANAEGLPPDELNGFEEGLAWESGAIYDFEEDHQYETDYQLSPQYNLRKYENTLLEGGKSELFMGYGANLDNVLLFGFTFNMPLVNYTENRIYREQDDIEDGVPFFNDLEYFRYVNTTGYGFNGKMGIILKPTTNTHISFAAHTPTRLFLTDNYNTTLSYDYTDENHSGPITSHSPYGSFQYALVTPWSLQGGLGIIAGDAGFISAGFKWTDYSSMRYDYSVAGNGGYYNYIEQETNEDIRINYSSAFDLYMGGEMVLDAIRLRGGVTMAQSPYVNDDSFDPAYHAGFGYRSDNFYVDFAYKWFNRDEGYLPYETSETPQPLVIEEYTTHSILTTLGFKF